MIAVRPAIREDIVNCQMDAATRSEIPDVKAAQDDLIDGSDSAWTCYDDETHEIYAIMGIALEDEVGHSWALFAEKMPSRQVGIRVIRFGVGILKWAHRTYDVDYIDMTQLDGFPKHQKWAETLGFEFIHLLENFGNHGETYRYYARTW